MAEFSKTYTFNCPYCGNAKIVKNGTQKGKQRYRCKSCSKQFNDTGAVNGYRVPAEHIGAAIRMYYGGMSYKQIGEQMADAYGMDEPDKRAIYEWVRDHSEVAANAIQDYPAHTTGKWVADEMQVKVGGEAMWNWNVMDASTRYILASHLSPNRDTRAAVAVMRKAVAAADGPPKSITSDKLGSYVPAIKQVFPEAEHIQAEGIRAELNNNLSERLQGTFRDREKTLRGLDSLESGQRYLDGWVVNYNLFREHEGIKHQTPGEMAGVNPPFKEWADIVRNAPALREGGKVNAIPTLADVADRADRHGPATAPPATHFVRDPTLRRRPKGETESDDPDEYPFIPAEAITAPQVTKLPARQPQGRTPSVKVAASTSKPTKVKGHPPLRPDKPKQEKAGKRRTVKRQHQYAKARKTHQQQGRKQS